MRNNLSSILWEEIAFLRRKLSMVTGISRTSIHGLYHERTENPDTKL